LSGIGVVRIKLIGDRGLERLVMRGKRAVLQSFGHINPTQAVLVQDKRRITWNCIKTFSAYLGLEVGRFSLYKSGNIDACPFLSVPPDQFFPFAPRTAVRPRAGAVVDDSTITWPCEPPTVTEIISRLA